MFPLKIEKEQHYTSCRICVKVLKGRCRGSAGIYLTGIFLLLLLTMVFQVCYTWYQVYVTADTLDDALVVSLVSAATVNTKEYGRTHQLVVYDDLQTPGNPLQDSQNLSAIDTYLQNAYSTFLESFIKNMDLTDTLHTQIPNIDGVLYVEEFNVYNVYRQFDDDGNAMDFRIYHYAYMNNNWTVTAYDINEPVYLFNSLDATNSLVENTTISAKITFDIYFMPFLRWVMPESMADSMHKQVSYQRLVDITNS